MTEQAKVKLTPAQRTALAALPVSITMWGGKPFAGMPDGIRSRSTLLALYRRGFAITRHEGTKEIWGRTATGDNALTGDNHGL